MSESGHIVHHDFDVFILSDKLYAKMEACPSCDSPKLAEDEESIGGGYQYVYGDLKRCPECEDYFLVVESPKMDMTLPVRTRWSVPILVFDEEEEELPYDPIITNPE